MATPGPTTLAQWAGIVMPTLFTGMTAADSLATRALLAAPVPPKLLTKQWLHLYQQGPYWVLPTVLTGLSSNLYLALYPSSSRSQNPRAAAFYLAAALAIGSILPITFLYFEPHVNGACKWKARTLLLDLESPELSGDNEASDSVIPSSEKQSATRGTRERAGRSDMSTLVVAWARANHLRWVVGLAAAGLSGYATLGL
ncbi:hypothetical protein B0T19DRAFT_227397 [Cercophora scortea]|uniref:Uncharacterized protein n=1 Tax=Cercophora scortea TaxID=314031 RepID=A0AAE0MA84_9PEZI|nr:hypothetical protein B0T19DRAFT_227397 [Cercophora scortea]